MSNSVTRQVSFNRTKIDEKCHNSKIQMRHFEEFSNNVSWSLNDQKTLRFSVLALELVINFQTWMTWKNQVIQL